ncbi:MAG: pseudouridine synthase, partial [Microbacterium sp.]
GTVTAQVIQKLTKGFDLEDGFIKADKARLLDASQGASLVELTLHSGRNRIVRRMMAEVGHPVTELVRRQFGPLHLGTLPAGKSRELTKIERGALLTLARHDAPADATPGDAQETE